MYNNDRNNVSAIALFDQALDQYEVTMEEIKTKPNLFSGPAQYLQQALNRIITASVADAYEMMRSLTQRMLSGLPCYSEYSLLRIASGTVNNVFRDEVMAIPYVILSVIRGEDPKVDSGWLNRVNGNIGIKSFLVNYKTSDIKIVHDTDVSNLCSVSLPYEKIFSANTNVIVPLGDKPVDITLSANEVQTLNFVKNETWLPTEPYRHDKPVIYGSYVAIRPGVKEFRIPKVVKLTPSAAEMISIIGCVTPESTVSNSYHFKMPGAFFYCQFEILSFDSGVSWTISNVKITPPSYI